MEFIGEGVSKHTTSGDMSKDGQRSSTVEHMEDVNSLQELMVLMKGQSRKLDMLISSYKDLSNKLHELQCTIDDLKCIVRIIEGRVDGTTSFKSNLFACVDPWDAYRVDPAEKSKTESQSPPTEPSVLYISDDDDYDDDAPRPLQSRNSFKKSKIEKETARIEQAATTTMRLGTPVSSWKKSNMPSSNKMNTTKQWKRKTCLDQDKIMNKVLCSMECPIDDSLVTYDITAWPISNPFVASEIDIDKVKMMITLALISERFNVLRSKAQCQAQMLMQAMDNRL
ncbi:hypothetical protein RIF29_15611 [Crotalaria pallida]|uniref:Uncharacterized protein n=1 Tax=Crotalaria pallida TaxID=3830 RepID=A0AAN9FM49_CROPI